MSELLEWDTFYVIVGAAGGALVGLQFVVMTLIGERPPTQFAAASAAFASPTVVHFSMVLLLSAMVRMPWTGPGTLALAWGLTGLGGLIYQIIVLRRMRTGAGYKPQFEDWVFHAILPLAAYVVTTVTALFTRSNLHEALFGVGFASLTLLFVGIHNAWDSVTFQIASRRKK